MLVLTAYAQRKIFIGDDIWFYIFYFNRETNMVKVKFFINGKYHIETLTCNQNKPYFITADIQLKLLHKTGRKQLQIGLNAPKSYIISREKVDGDDYSTFDNFSDFDFSDDNNDEPYNENKVYIKSNKKGKNNNSIATEDFDNWFHKQLHS